MGKADVSRRPIARAGEIEAGEVGAGEGGQGLLSERLLTVLTREMLALEHQSQETIPTETGAGATAAAKARVEAVGQMTRTLEKLLELKRLEALALRGDDAAEDAEAVRLRAEMLKRLRILDARRDVCRRLFAADGTLAGDGSAEIAGAEPA